MKIGMALYGHVGVFCNSYTVSTSPEKKNDRCGLPSLKSILISLNICFLL